MEAISWLRKQIKKPVTAFDIIPAAATDTLDQQIGLVKEWKIDAVKNRWARFEVGRSTNAPARASVPGWINGNNANINVVAGCFEPTVYPTPGNLGAYKSKVYANGLDWGAEDISLMRGQTMPGMVWRLRCRAYTFQRDPGKDWTTQPFSLSNAAEKPIDKIELESEVSMTQFQPRTAAIYSFDDDVVDTGTIPNHSGVGCTATGGHIRIHGNSSVNQVDLAVRDGLGYNVWSNTNQVQWTATPAGNEVGSNLFGPSLIGMSSTSNPNYVSPKLGDQLNYTFGVPDVNSIASIADYTYDASSTLPAVLPQMALIYIDATGMSGSGQGNTLMINGNGVGASTQLSGGGIIVVNGGLQIDGTHYPQAWNGLIFTTGVYHQFAGTKVVGGVIAGKHVIIHGAPNNGAVSGIAHLNYSRATLEDVCRQVANYHEQRSTLTIVPGSAETIY
jgi:hypothetical protein